MNIVDEEIHDTAILEFRAGIRSVLGDRLREIWLFGSRARGDNRPDSDYDFLVVAEGDRTELRKIVADQENEIMLRLGAICASVVYTPGLWERTLNTPFGMNVRREGIRIA